jgi:F420-0:gamma-glutamyl ligase
MAICRLLPIADEAGKTNLDGPWLKLIWMAISDNVCALADLISKNLFICW